ncbi:unnamed protein product [Pleuronectes platessa]|uniref:Uncharacterized protein n=1 Tax=Pleuronectes platessa TaxID=8262 RepID=A0A9N7ULP8_PLEPL|nr:unnamed protein product [Pleuronectes platessa]
MNKFCPHMQRTQQQTPSRCQDGFQNIQASRHMPGWMGGLSALINKQRALDGKHGAMKHRVTRSSRGAAVGVIDMDMFESRCLRQSQNCGEAASIFQFRAQHGPAWFRQGKVLRCLSACRLELGMIQTECRDHIGPSC